MRSAGRFDRVGDWADRRRLDRLATARGSSDGLRYPCAAQPAEPPRQFMPGVTDHPFIGKRWATRQDLSLRKGTDLGGPGTAKVRVGVFAQLDYFLFADDPLGPNGITSADSAFFRQLGATAQFQIGALIVPLAFRRSKIPLAAA
jgi:hypothetical protein